MKTNRFFSENSSNSTRQRILFLDSMRATAIIMVIGVHSLAYCLPLPTDQKGIISFIVQTIPVPVFFLVDGYLFALHISSPKEYHYFKYIRKSITRLLVPWAIFTILYAIARYYFELNGYLTEQLILGHSIKEVVISAYGSVYSAQMYFLVSLFLVRLLTPIFKQVIQIKRYPVLLILFICVFIIYNLSSNVINPLLKIEGGQEPVTHALWGIQYYLIGIILFRTFSIVKPEKLFFPFLSLFFIAMIFHVEIWQWHYGHNLIQYLYLITFFLLFTHIGDKLSFLNIIGKNTMGIYLVHAPIILKIISLIMDKTILSPLFNFLSILFGTLILSVCAVIVIKYLPYGTLLFGEPKMLLANKQSK